MSVKKQRALQPCTALLRDGSRCGKYAKAGEVFCAVHQPDYKPKGAAVPRPKPVTHEERLRRFAESPDPRVAMQAIGILEKRRTNEDGSPAFDGRAFLNALTTDEREQVRSLIAQLREIQRAVYEREPRLRPQTWAPDSCVIDAADVVVPAEPIEEAAIAPPSPIEEAPQEDPDEWEVV